MNLQVTGVELKPRLRGVFHAAMVPVALIGGIPLLTRPSTVGGRISVGVFVTLLLGLYGTSSLYHVPPWSAKVKRVLGRCDTAMITLFIAGTFTPVAFFTLSGPWRLWSLVVAWMIALVGAGIAISPLEAPRWLTAVAYIAMGWLSIVPFVKIAASLHLGNAALIVLGGVLYSVGAVVYARKWPDPAPRWFGYHEVFHLFVIAASVCHYIAIYRVIL